MAQYRDEGQFRRMASRITSDIVSLKVSLSTGSPELGIVAREIAQLAMEKGPRVAVGVLRSVDRFLDILDEMTPEGGTREKGKAGWPGGPRGSWGHH